MYLFVFLCRDVYVGKQGSPRKRSAVKKPRPPSSPSWRPTRSMAGCPRLCQTAECSAVNPLTPTLAGQTQLAPTHKTTHHANSTIIHVHLSLFHSRVVFFGFCFCVSVLLLFLNFLSSPPPKVLENRHAVTINTPPQRSDFRSPISYQGRFFPPKRPEREVCVRTCVCMFVPPLGTNCKCGFLFSLFLFSFFLTHTCTRAVGQIGPCGLTHSCERLLNEGDSSPCPVLTIPSSPLFSALAPFIFYSTELALLLTVSLCSCRVIYI